jgi:major membrane immunogen (membrane-anchored lipoprotein)
MKKTVILIIAILMMALTLVGCGNKDLFDTVRTYDYALVSFPDGTSEKIEIKQWRDYEDGEQIQIIAKDGNIYLVNSVNCVLVNGYFD